MPSLESVGWYLSVGLGVALFMMYRLSTDAIFLRHLAEQPTVERNLTLAQTWLAGVILWPVVVFTYTVAAFLWAKARFRRHFQARG